MFSETSNKIFKKKQLFIARSEKCKLEIMQLHGRLYHVYLHAVGTKKLHAAYFPKEKHVYTYIFWIVNILAILTIPLSMVQNPTAQLLSLSSVIILAPIYYFLNNWCIEKSLAVEFSKVGIERKLSMQLVSIKHELLRTMWFFEKTMEEINPSIIQIEKCIEFSEATHKDALPFMASYFRHPLTLLLLGALFYIFNSKMSEFVGPINSGFWLRSMPIILLVFWTLIIGYQLHDWKFQDLQKNGKFLRSLRWILIEMKNKKYS